MVEIRKLQPTVKLRKLTPVDMRESRTPRAPNLLVVERRRKDFLPPTALDTPCVIWQGSMDPDGYGRRKIKVRPGTGPNQGWTTISMHRWVVEQVLGRKLRKDEVVMHLCDNRICYRHDHLEIGTTQSNTADMVGKGRNKKPPVHHYRGTTNPNARLTEGHIAWVKELSAAGHYQRTISQMTGISRSHVQRILAGTAWWHIHNPNAKGPPDEYRIRPGTNVPRRKPGSERADGGDPEGTDPGVEAGPGSG